ncbi:S-layer homology domain-containing protein [Lysinibacillus sp. BW-2-10]|uniref:S-layer homology domain-containing protein n=1 Tax=Lysinibacillus sp. BW-2-10 TaxID=2590030 RepID=UPI001180218C|nr:S-layer homology domain-containing protein [Lysinibacillus sp. BW-2-10]TSI07370.1 hypothetical protein FJQ64_08700 [Lysinibacillus sp. BW-2-10]
MKYLIKSILITVVAVIFVSFSFERTSAKILDFKDVQSDSYYYEAILRLGNEGVVNGFPDGTYKPEQKVTRVQAAIVLAKVLQLDIDDPSDPKFTDVPIKHPNFKEIAAVANAGIMNGSPNKTFNPNIYLTRAEMAKIIVEAFNLNQDISSSSIFQDVEPTQWYADAVQTLVKYGITTGITATTFEPKSPVTRGQFAVFIVKAKNSNNIVAGNGEYGSENGKSLEASFRSPSSIAISNNGGVLVSDTGNHLLRLVLNDKVSTFAGMIFKRDKAGQLEGGLYNDEKEYALFSEPSGISVDRDENIYVADSKNHAIRKISGDGVVTTIAGNGFQGHTDGLGEQALFNFPQDIAVSRDGVIYVADTLNHVIRKIDTSGNVTTLNTPSTRSIEVVSGVAEIAGDFQDGTLSEAKFNEPSGLALDSKGNLFVADTGNQLIRYINFTNNTVSTVAGKLNSHNAFYATGGYKDGKAKESLFSAPRGISVTTEGGLLIADSLNHAIRYLKDGRVKTIGDNFNNPTDVVQMNESILVVDSYSNRIQKIYFNE